MNIAKNKAILTEQKEEMPISFLTTFVSDGWSEVGNLKEEIVGIKSTFKNSSKVIDILQDLLDAYLVAIGQAELYLQNKDYIDIPEIEEASPVQEVLTSPNAEIITEKIEPEINLDEILNESKVRSRQPNLETFDCDFDEPDLSEPKLTDADLYGKNE